MKWDRYAVWENVSEREMGYAVWENISESEMGYYISKILPKDKTWYEVIQGNLKGALNIQFDLAQDRVKWKFSTM